MPTTLIRDEQVRDAPAIAAGFTALGLGPIQTATLHIPPRGQYYHQIELCPAPAAAMAANLLQWMELLDVIDMISGRFTATDTTVRLNLRGRLDHDLIVVIGPVNDPAAVALIDARPNRRHPERLLTQLAALPIAS